MGRTNLRTLKIILLTAFVVSAIASCFFPTSWDLRNFIPKHIPSPLPAYSIPDGFCSGLRDSRNGSDHLQVTWQILTRLYETDKLDFSQVQAYSIHEEYGLSELDQEILRDDPLQDVSTVATHVTSTIIVVGPQNATLRQGDLLTVRVDMKDSLGRPVRKGGHEVRVWIADKSRGLSAAVDVDDLRNGSYLASIPLLWPGKATVLSALMLPREYKRLVLDGLQKRKSAKPIFGGFMKGDMSETTICMSYPVIPCYPEVCDFTSENGGLPWFCGKPVKSELSCGDWTISRSPAADTQPKADSAPKVQLKKKMRDCFNGQRIIRHLQQTVSVDVKEGILPRNNISCYQKPRRETWSDQSPHGYWENKQWHHLKCSVPTLTPDFIKRCVRNKTFVMLGDSNARAIEEELSRLSECPIRYVNPKKSKFTMHLSNFCNNSELHFTQEWHPHAFPFVNVDAWSLRKNKISPADYMAKISATGDFVIFIHLYAHFHWSDSTIYPAHVRDTARGVRELLKRKPSAKVVVRGPHPWNSIKGDFHGLRSFLILRKEFKGLEDQVILLNFWDMNIANENNDVHPEKYTVHAMTNVFLGLICS